MPQDRYSIDSVRILKIATTDDAYALLELGQDVALMVSFVARLVGLGWFPPNDQSSTLLVQSFGVTMHLAHANLAFYEYKAMGGRGERQPWLTLFFYVHRDDGVIRLCGVERTEMFDRHREQVLAIQRIRVERLNKWLERMS